MNLSILDYEEKIESKSSHWSLVISFGQMTNTSAYLGFARHKSLSKSDK